MLRALCWYNIGREHGPPTAQQTLAVGVHLDMMNRLVEGCRMEGTPEQRLASARMCAIKGYSGRPLPCLELGQQRAAAVGHLSHGLNKPAPASAF
jgi:hypothetical protein